MPNFFLDLGIGYPTFNIFFFFGTQEAKIQKIAENRRKYSRITCGVEYIVALKAYNQSEL